MKILIHLARRTTDFSTLFARFPQVSFAIARTLDDYAREIADADALVVWSSDYVPEIAALTKQAPRLSWIQFATSGMDGPLKRGGLPSGVLLTNMAGLRAPNLAEHAFMLLLFLSRRMRMFEQARVRKEWARRASESQLVSFRAATALVLGMGAIGQAVARRARAFDMRVIGVSRLYRPDGVVERIFPREAAREAFAQADVVFVCLPSDASTRGFVDAEKLRAMKAGAFLINVSRGDIVVENDLVEACRDGWIAGAGVDVAAIEPLPQDSPLWTLDNVAITPHVGGSGSEESGLLIDMIAENVERRLEGRPLLRRVEV